MDPTTTIIFFSFQEGHSNLMVVTIASQSTQTLNDVSNISDILEKSHLDNLCRYVFTNKRSVTLGDRLLGKILKQIEEDNLVKERLNEKVP